MRNDIVAVVPVKGLDAGRSRLASTYSPEFRSGLAKAMLEDVLATLAAARELAGVLIVTVDPLARELAQRFGARVLQDGAELGHTAAVMSAARCLSAEHRSAMLTVPGDVPCITTQEIARLVAVHRDPPAFTIVPSRDQRGSNAILMSPPAAVPLCFGSDSFLPHLDAARLAGIEPSILPMPGIGLDIDGAADLALLLRRPLPMRTWAFLAAQKMVSAGP
jgi:2-phospho-L-lactate guanylyltransferase